MTTSKLVTNGDIVVANGDISVVNGDPLYTDIYSAICRDPGKISSG